MAFAFGACCSFWTACFTPIRGGWLFMLLGTVLAVLARIDDVAVKIEGEKRKQ